MKMKTTFLSAVILAGVSNIALADWSGFYIGPQVSYTWMSTSWQASNDVVSTNFYPDGFSIGPHLGYAYQKDALVFGLEGSYSGGSFSGQEGLDADTAYKTKVSQLFTITPLLGYAKEAWLVYGKAGYTSGKVEVDTYDASGNTFSDSERQSGWIAGAGVAYKLGESDSVGFEYDFSRLGGTDFSSSSQVNVNPININSVALNYTHYFW